VADYIEGKIKLPAKKPPLAFLYNMGGERLYLRAAANEVEKRKAQWKKDAGRLPRGSAERAIEEVVKIYCPPLDPDKFGEKLRALLRRPKHDREWR
jgi:hypothetical protein